MNKQTYRAGCTASKGGQDHSLIRKGVDTRARAKCSVRLALLLYRYTRTREMQLTMISVYVFSSHMCRYTRTRVMQLRRPYHSYLTH